MERRTITIPRGKSVTCSIDEHDVQTSPGDDDDMPTGTVPERRAICYTNAYNRGLRPVDESTPPTWMAGEFDRVVITPSAGASAAAGFGIDAANGVEWRAESKAMTCDITPREHGSRSDLRCY